VPPSVAPPDDEPPDDEPLDEPPEDDVLPFPPSPVSPSGLCWALDAHACTIHTTPTARPTGDRFMNALDARSERWA